MHIKSETWRPIMHPWTAKRVTARTDNSCAGASIAPRSLLYKSNRALQLETLMSIYWIIIALGFPSQSSISTHRAAARSPSPPLYPRQPTGSHRPSVRRSAVAVGLDSPDFPGCHLVLGPRRAGDDGGGGPGHRSTGLARPVEGPANDDGRLGVLFVLRSLWLRRCFHGTAARLSSSSSRYLWQ